MFEKAAACFALTIFGIAYIVFSEENPQAALQQSQSSEYFTRKPPMAQNLQRIASGGPWYSLN